MYQPSATNFMGRDPMQWWIGQVTDPVKGEWGDALEKTRDADPDKKDIYSHRCRVRIIGYHGCEDDLPDKDLPLAHVLLPPNTTTTGACGETMEYQGGEVVVGFFIDGADAQQPVIFGTLFRQHFIEDEIKQADYNAKKQTCFKPWTPPEVTSNLNKNQVALGSVKKNFVTNNAEKNVAHNQKEEATNGKFDNATACQDNEVSKISNTIKEFTQKAQKLQKLSGANEYVNTTYGGITDIQSELKLTSNKLHNSMTKLVRRGRSWVIQDTLEKLNTTLKDKVAKPLQAPTAEATNSLVNTMFCNFEKIQDGLLDYLFDSLENMLGQVLDVPICGIENFLSDMFGQINNILDTSLGDMFGQLNSISPGIGLPSKTFSKAIKFANIITSALDCDAQNCPPNTTFSAKSGTSLSGDDDFSNITSKMGLSSLVDPFLETLDNAIPAVPSAPDCSTNVLKCGPPRVDFVGGGGEGATGSAIVNVLGQVIGVSILGKGSGYSEPPLLSFFDSCENGYGAGGYVRLNDDGTVKDVVMISGGQEYLPNTTETDFDGNVKEVIPDPNANYDGAVSYVTTLSDVVVQNTGFGYSDGDTITVSGGSATSTTGDGDGVGQAEVELNIQDGLIVGANVVNGGFGFTSIPNLTINSDTGALAKLKPVLQFTKVDDASQLAQISQDAVVTVISCIEK